MIIHETKCDQCGKAANKDEPKYFWGTTPLKWSVFLETVTKGFDFCSTKCLKQYVAKLKDDNEENPEMKTCNME